MLVTTGAWIYAVPIETVQMITLVLITALVDLGDGWLGWILSPFNSIAALLVAVVKAIRMFRSKLISASYAS